MPAAKAAAVRLRGTTVPVISVMIRDADLQRLQAEVARKVHEAGGSLTGGLAVIDLSALTGRPVELDPLVTLVRSLGLIPVAVQGAPEACESDVLKLGLAALPAETAGRRPAVAVAANDATEPASIIEDAPASSSAAEAPAAPTAETEDASLEATPAAAGIAAASAVSALVLDRPLRSGQRIYARGRDLVVLAPTSAGSELIADGNIHCYGPLRGRALAGASGDDAANIFALDFQAELVSIAGIYRAFEELPEKVRGKPVRASLQHDGEQRRILLAPLAG